MKKIKISANYDSSQNLTERLIRQFKTEKIDLSDTKFVFEGDYDIIIFFNYVNESILDGKKSYVFPHEPSWTGSHQKHFDGDTTVFGFSEDLYVGNCVESISYTYYGGRGPWVDDLDFWNYNNLINLSPEKSKIISSSITNLNYDYGGTCLYKERYDLLQNIKKINNIDVFDGSISPKRKDALIDYMFNISIENSHEKNWITEKFYDNILTNTIPIYFGCKNIKEIFPEDGYFLIEDIRDYDKINSLIKSILENPKEIYDSKIEGLHKIKKRYFEDYNLLNKINNL